MRARLVQTEMLCNLETRMCRDAEDNFYDRTEGVQRQKRAAESEALDAATLLGQKVHCPKGSPYYAVMPSAVLCFFLSTMQKIRGRNYIRVYKQQGWFVAVLYVVFLAVLPLGKCCDGMGWNWGWDGRGGKGMGWGGMGWDPWSRARHVIYGCNHPYIIDWQQCVQSLAAPAQYQPRFWLHSDCTAELCHQIVDVIMCRRLCKQRSVAYSLCWLKKNRRFLQQRRTFQAIHNHNQDRQKQTKKKKMSWMLSWARLLCNWNKTRLGSGIPLTLMLLMLLNVCQTLMPGCCWRAVPAVVTPMLLILLLMLPEAQT